MNILLNNKIIELLKQIHEEEQKIKDCDHEFGERVYEPEEVGDLKYEPVALTEHVRYVITGRVTVRKDRWTNDCKKCGRKSYIVNK